MDAELALRALASSLSSTWCVLLYERRRRLRLELGVIIHSSFHDAYYNFKLGDQVCLLPRSIPPSPNVSIFPGEQAFKPLSILLPLAILVLPRIFMFLNTAKIPRTILRRRRPLLVLPAIFLFLNKIKISRSMLRQSPPRRSPPTLLLAISPVARAPPTFNLLILHLFFRYDLAVAPRWY